MTYTPQSVDTSSVELPEELVNLREVLAENTHEVWAEGRVAKGWTYGPKRNDDAKHHPCLVPYADLSESERSYDRNTAEESIKLLLALGWTLTPPS